MILESLGITGITLLVLSLLGVFVWGLIWSAKTYAKGFWSYMFGGVKDWWEDFTGWRRAKIVKAGHDVTSFLEDVNAITQQAAELEAKWITSGSFREAWYDITQRAAAKQSVTILHAILGFDRANTGIQKGVLAVVKEAPELEESVKREIRDLHERYSVNVRPSGSPPQSPPTYSWTPPQSPPPAPSAPAASPTNFDWSRYTQANDDDRRNDNFLHNAKQSAARHPGNPNSQNLYEVCIQYTDNQISPTFQTPACNLVQWAESLRPEQFNGRWQGRFSRDGVHLFGRLIVTKEIRRG